MAFLRNLKSHAPLAINKYRPLGAAASVRARIVISNFLKGEREREKKYNIQQSCNFDVKWKTVSPSLRENPFVRCS